MNDLDLCSIDNTVIVNHDVQVNLLYHKQFLNYYLNQLLDFLVLFFQNSRCHQRCKKMKKILEHKSLLIKCNLNKNLQLPFLNENWIPHFFDLRFLNDFWNCDQIFRIQWRCLEKRVLLMNFQSLGKNHLTAVSLTD